MTFVLWHLTHVVIKNGGELCIPKVISSPILRILCQSKTLYTFSSLFSQDLCPALLLSPIHLGLFCFEDFWWSRVDDLLTIINWNEFLDWIFSPLMNLNSTYVKILYIVKDVSDTRYPENYYLGASYCFISIILNCWSKATGEEGYF